MVIVEWLFWGALGLILYTYIGFPLLLAIRAAIFPKRVKRIREVPTVSIIIAAHNEANFIIQKLDNVFALNYPRTHLEVIVASDGSTDDTEKLVSRYSRAEVHLLSLPRQGKNRTLNAAVSASRGEILVFTDADTMMEPQSLRHLIAPFTDRSIGAVGGDYRYNFNAHNGNNESTYWEYDRVLKWLQSRAGSMTSATGQIFAIRRQYFNPIPEKLVDDFYTSVQAPAAHKRLIFERRAIAYGPIAETTEAEFQRKVRVITGGLRSVWTMRVLLNPLRYGFYAIQLLTHKVLRRLLVLPLIITAVAAPLLWSHGLFYQSATLVQAAFHGFALLTYLLRNTAVSRIKVLNLPLFFDMVNIASLVAVVNLIYGTRHDIWKPQRAAAHTAHLLQ
jgi:cellulose synthase/poly-beta-1,6-N-acetylglucosamine synthase-like glycosyltransferase